MTCGGEAEAMRALLARSTTEIASSPTSMATVGCGGLVLSRSAVAVFLNDPKTEEENFLATFGTSRQRVGSPAAGPRASSADRRPIAVSRSSNSGAHIVASTLSTGGASSGVPVATR
ncbi:hypothetical protein MKUB_23460 [Mycobacterium kubicae]|uniref:Uncharacterized protein n=1 Tax=Mycobacterium kubicae TaxID=120959 RepID=A0AAX1JIG3_9MYCO|nr:hypothetical protein [Mycobacterium kubicae]MCV7098731.1 hypothetical protein [Mycobacterium kubicae]QNI11922.1 hypothetical protein GAN18_12505 [Mycobacterium kubicae]QPI40148.1 hypothetical protein I2456_12345 [Mycobacterium kubicae]GFG64856.1 hypothetical protein MKUB_23460 [Mycobacterium kubicae]